MKVAMIADDGTVTTYADPKNVVNVYDGEKLTITFEASPLHSVTANSFKGAEAKNELTDYFSLKAIKRGKRIAKCDIRKGDLIRMVDHAEPSPGDRDYKTLEYVATANGDGGYQFNRGEKFYLIDRPKPELPTTPGTVVEVRLNDGNGVRRIVLGKDGLWRGQDVHAEAEMVKRNAEILRVIA